MKNLNKGDLLILEPDDPPWRLRAKSRYSRGIILEGPTSLGVLTVAWHDGKIERENINISQYYTVVPQ